MRRPNPWIVIAEGFVATAGLTIVVYMLPLFGLPRANFPDLLGSLFSAGRLPRVGSSPWMLGFLWHFLNGSVIFALIYAYLVSPRAGSVAPWLRGAAWGAVLWLAAMLLFMPLMGQGVFAAEVGRAKYGILTGMTDRPYLYWISALVGHLVYGIVLGVLVSTRSARLPASESAPAAGHGPGASTR